MASTLKVDNIVATDGTSAPITLSADTATLGTGTTIASGVTGTLGSGVIFPVDTAFKWTNGGEISNTGTVSADGSFGNMAIVISSTNNDVLLLTYIVASKNNSGSTTYSNLYIQGGGLGSGTGGKKLTDNLGYGSGVTSKSYITGMVFDTAPGSTSFNYSYYFDYQDSTFNFYRQRYVYAEIQK
jgi:hypothetical protein